MQIEWIMTLSKLLIYNYIIMKEKIVTEENLKVLLENAKTYPEDIWWEKNMTVYIREDQEDSNIHLKQLYKAKWIKIWSFGDEYCIIIEKGEKIWMSYEWMDKDYKKRF